MPGKLWNENETSGMATVKPDKQQTANERTADQRTANQQTANQQTANEQTATHRTTACSSEEKSVIGHLKNCLKNVINNPGEEAASQKVQVKIDNFISQPDFVKEVGRNIQLFLILTEGGQK